MRKGALAGAVALAMGMISLTSVASAQELASVERGRSESSGVVVKESYIARLKSVLNLTAEQRPYWAPVEAALRDLARNQRDEASADAGVVHRWSGRAVSVAGDAMRIRRLAAAARPLIGVLDDGQKRDAMQLARNLGFDRLVAAF
jgi:hypothetical protein